MTLKFLQSDPSAENLEKAQSNTELSPPKKKKKSRNRQLMEMGAVMKNLGEEFLGAH